MIDSIIPFVLSHFVLAYGMAYTAPSSPLRPFLLLLIIISCLISVHSSTSLLIPGQVGNEYIIGFVFHASHFLCLVKLSPPPYYTSASRDSWAFNQVFDARWGISYIPPFSSKSKTYTPPRLNLFLRRLWDSVWTIGLIYLLQTNRLSIQNEDIHEGLTRTLRNTNDLTSRELIIRIYFLIDGYTIPYCGLRAAHSLLSCLALACGSTPERWPPLFGSLADAYTVRRWYSHFWHHLMRRAFTSHARFLSITVLRFPTRSTLTRYVIIILTFAISAGFHIVSAPGAERCRAMPQVWFYVRIVGAILVEDAAIRCFGGRGKGNEVGRVSGGARGGGASKENGYDGRKDDELKIVKRDDGGNGRVDKLLWRLVGYSWVFTFQVWAVSQLTYDLWFC